MYATFSAHDIRKEFYRLTHTQNLHLLQQSFKIFGHVHTYSLVYFISIYTASIKHLDNVQGEGEGVQIDCN